MTDNCMEIYFPAFLRFRILVPILYTLDVYKRQLFREQLAFPQTDGIFVLFFRYIFKPFPLFLNAFHNNFS